MSVGDGTELAAGDGRRETAGDSACERNGQPDRARGLGGSSVDADNPWLGLASFTEETQAYFFGREGEVAELTRRVQRKLLTVLFGKSGLGKTSILRAGLVPRVRSQGYFPVYLRIDYGHDTPEPAEQIKDGINRAAASAQWTQTAAVSGESIWEFLHHRDAVLKDASGATLIPLLIFDQFEELFTLTQSDEFGRARAARFVEEVADLVENRPPKALEAKLETDDGIVERFDFSRRDYRVVIALREDYLAPLESLKKAMPSLAQNRLRLAPMTGNQALEAVLEPGKRTRSGKPLVSGEVAEAIVRFVAGGSELANAEVEPSLLSLICRELNEQRIAQGRSEISQDLLAGSHETILSNFYARSLSDQPDSVRRIIEDDLLTESGYRENLAEESLLRRFQAAGAGRDALATLVNRRLLRIEERLDVRRVELTHDVLTGVVKASRDQRHEREAREAAERALAEQQVREHAAQRALHRARMVAAGCTLLALLAISAAVFALLSLRRAHRAELIAQQTRTISEQARQGAEGLLGFLSDSFVSELETFGRFQTIAELSQREIDYFERLPPQLEDPQTIRSGALALINHAKALVYLSDLGTARKSATAAIALLVPLARADKSDATTTALGYAYSNLCFVLLGRGNNRSADTHDACQRAVDLLRPVAEEGGQPIAARRAYIKALAWLGLQEILSSRNEDVVHDGREGERVAKELGIPKDGDPLTDVRYADLEAYFSHALVNLGDDAQALQVGEHGLDVADHVLAQRPDYGEALGAKVMLGSHLVAVAADDLDPAEASDFGRQQRQAALALLRIEPKNNIYRNDLGLADSALCSALWAAGQLRQAIGYGQQGLDAFGQAGGAGFGTALLSVAEGMAQTAFWQSQLGDFSGARETVAAANAFLVPSVIGKLGPAGHDTEALISAFQAITTAEIAYERGDFAEARRAARVAAAGPRAHGHDEQIALYNFSDLEGHADYALGNFAAAAQAERTALKAAKASTSSGVSDQRTVARIAIWLSMALAREGKRAEAARTIDPVVAMYRTLEGKNHGDRWLLLEFAQALYAQSLTDGQRHAALLREASQRFDHLIPAIARLHDPRQWRARIEGRTDRR